MFALLTRNCVVCPLGTRTQLEESGAGGLEMKKPAQWLHMATIGRRFDIFLHRLRLRNCPLKLRKVPVLVRTSHQNMGRICIDYAEVD